MKHTAGARDEGLLRCERIMRASRGEKSLESTKDHVAHSFDERSRSRYARCTDMMDNEIAN